MSKFYNYDARGASEATQIINLGRMVQERDDEIERLRGELIKERLLVRHIDQTDADLAANLGQEIKRLRSFVEWILEAYDSDEWPAQKDIVAGAREALNSK